jgi:hypothetical protein
VLDEAQLSRESMEVEVKGIESRRDLFKAICSGMDQLVSMWEEEANLFDVARDKRIGDSILVAFYLVFGGQLDADWKTTALGKVQLILQQSGFISSSDSPLQVLRTAFVLSGLEQAFESDPTGVDGQHILLAVRCPLVIDPGGIVTSLILNAFPADHIVSTAQATSRLEIVIANAITDGKLLLTNDVDYLSSVFESVFDLAQSQLRIPVNGPLGDLVRFLGEGSPHHRSEFCDLDQLWNDPNIQASCLLLAVARGNVGVFQQIANHPRFDPIRSHLDQAVFCSLTFATFSGASWQ